MPSFHPVAESIVSQGFRCVNYVPLFGVHSALCSQIPISITGYIITQHREAAAHQVWGVVEGAFVKVMWESGKKSYIANVVIHSSVLIFTYY